MKAVLTIFMILLVENAYSLCDQSFEHLEMLHKKENEIETKFIMELREKAESILVVRAISAKYRESNQGHDQLVKMRVLKTIKGKHNKGEVLTKSIFIKDDYEITVCGDPDPREVQRVSAMDPKFKYLVYLKGEEVVRVNQFSEWVEYITPEMELQLIK